MNKMHRALGAKKKPICCRYLFVAGALLSSTALADAWTIEKGRERILSHPHFEELTKAAVLREQARGRAALPWSNPYIGYQREQSFGLSATGNGSQVGISGTGENFLWVGQKFDFSFRRGLFEEAGLRRGEAAQLLGEARRRDVVVLFEQLYFSALASDHIKDAADRWVKRLSELVNLARARESAGDASQYDVLRLEREILQAQRQRDNADIRRAQERAELASWLDDDPAKLQLAGDLRPPAPPPAAELPRPLHALALDEEARALAMEQDAAGRWYLPPVTATAGGKTVFGHQGLAPQVGEVGYLLTLQVPIPVLNRAGAKIDELAAARRVAAAEADMEAHHVVRRAAAARAVWARAHRALSAHEERASARADSLVTTARAAWAGGELSLLALLEAERTTLDDELTVIELSMAARNAQVAYAAVTMETSK